MLPILCYHKVGSSADEGRWLNIEALRLESHVRFFGRRGFEFITLSELAHRWPERGVAFTFDDAYVSALVHGQEVFNRHQARATFYAVPGRVGETSSWDGDRARPLADWDTLSLARENRHEIGNHSMSHRRLGELSPEEQFRELDQARDALRQRGFETISVAYPYGSYNEQTANAAQQAWLQIGVKLEKRPAYETDNRLMLPRIIVAYSDALPKLLYKIHVRPRLPR